MPPIKEITISGFRGILRPLTLELEKRSMTIYGRNGTGKSSITDALEWLHSGKIGHLSREGAKERSYPHRDASHGKTYVEIKFGGSELDRARLDYDHGTVTKPRESADLRDFREQVSHPFYIRFDDLKDFVYLTKGDKYKKLAHLMGFTPQVEFQEQLERVVRKWREKVQTQKSIVGKAERELLGVLDCEEVSENAVLAQFDEVAEKYGGDVTTLTDAIGFRSDLKKQVEENPVLKRIAELGTVTKKLDSVEVDVDLKGELEAYFERADQFKEMHEDAVGAFLLRLYEEGEKAISRLADEEQDVNRCPLCDQSYQGDLADHVSSRLEELKDLQDAKDQLERSRSRVRRAMQQLSGLLDKLAFDSETTFATQDHSLIDLQEHARELSNATKKFRDSLPKAESVSEDGIGSLRTGASDLLDEVQKFQVARSALLKATIRKRADLENTSDRKKLVADYEKLSNGIERWKKLQSARKQCDRYSNTLDELSSVVENYVEHNIENVQERFDSISGEVKRYFELLEADSNGLEDPALILLPNKDRAVMLEVGFHGERTKPAYKHLSESQLNSFGLAIFVASAKRFNPSFKFLVLDDVVNSFDSHKRPKMIDLIKDELPDHQILILTHDSVWRKQLADHFPSWKRKKFVQWKPHVGTIVHEDTTGLEYIEELLDQDRPETAGGEMGRFMERQLQLLCESFEALVKYNRRNEYTLDPLYKRFRARVENKLGGDHELFQLIEDLERSSSYRNFCAHWKNPESPITTSEMRSVASTWKRIDDIVRCDECHRFPRYEGNGFKCGCGEHRLVK